MVEGYYWIMFVILVMFTLRAAQLMRLKLHRLAAICLHYNSNCHKNKVKKKQLKSLNVKTIMCFNVFYGNLNKIYSLVYVMYLMIYNVVGASHTFQSAITSYSSYAVI